MIKIDCKESDIEDILAKHLDEKLNIKYLDRQYRTPVGIIDIIAKSHTDKNCYYVIEIKNGTLGSDAYAQVLRYCNWMNSEESKDGKRYFIPLLIGDFLSEQLNHLCDYFDDDGGYGRHNIKDVLYRCFKFDPMTGISFNYHSTTQMECKDIYIYGFNHLYQIEEELDCANYSIHCLKMEMASCE